VIERHDRLGIKQTIQKQWMDRVLRMLLSGMSEPEIRNDLNSYLSNQKQSGGVGERGIKTYGMAIAILASWFSPRDELLGFRDEALSLVRTLPEEMWLPIHWAVISSSYPFWFNVARQIGRLLSLQEQITRSQIFNRLKEQYGARETVSRNARYCVRSFVAWGVLKDSKTRGCYERGTKLTISNHDVAILMIESALYADPGGKALGLLCNHPAFFPFKLPVLSGNVFIRRSNRLDVIRHGLDDELVLLRK